MEPSNRKNNFKSGDAMIVRFNNGLITVNRLFVAVLFALLGVLAVWVWLGVFDNEPPTETVTDENGKPKREVLTPEVYPGSMLKIQVTTIPHRICESKVDRILYDGENKRKILDQPTEYTSSVPAELEKPSTFIYEVRIPDGVTSGRSSYVVQAKYRCTTFQKLFGPIIGEVVTIPFVIKARTDEEQKAFEAVKKLIGKPEAGTE